KNHEEACLTNTIPDFMFSQVLGVWVRASADPAQAYDYYCRAEEADSSWATQLARQDVPQGSSRLEAFKDEVKAYWEVLEHQTYPSFAAYDHLNPVLFDPSTIPNGGAIQHLPFLPNPPYNASGYNQAYDPTLPQGWHSLGRPNLSLRKAALYRLPI
ncbi:hypothetical protein JCM3765_007397, partial [Sporobolomyces pararoseus]